MKDVDKFSKKAEDIIQECEEQIKNLKNIIVTQEKNLDNTQNEN